MKSLDVTCQLRVFWTFVTWLFYFLPPGRPAPNCCFCGTNPSISFVHVFVKRLNGSDWDSFFFFSLVFTVVVVVELVDVVGRWAFSTLHTCVSLTLNSSTQTIRWIIQRFLSLSLPSLLLWPVLSWGLSFLARSNHQHHRLLSSLLCISSLRDHANIISSQKSIYFFFLLLNFNRIFLLLKCATTNARSS